MLINDQEDMERSPGRKPNGPNPVGRSFVIAVDRKTGETRWQTDTKTYMAGYSTPCVYQAEGGRAELIFSTTAHGILAIDPATGKKNWEFGEPFLDRAVISPVVAPGLVIAGHGAGIRGSSLHRRAAGLGRCSQSHLRLAYELTTAIPMVPTPWSRMGGCISGATTEWCRACAWPRAKWFGGSGSTERIMRRPSGSMAVCTTCRRTGEVVVVAAGDKFEVLHRIPLGEPSYATPAVAGGVMYLRTSSHLFSLGGSK